VGSTRREDANWLKFREVRDGATTREKNGGYLKWGNKFKKNAKFIEDKGGNKPHAEKRGTQMGWKKTKRREATKGRTR